VDIFKVNLPAKPTKEEKEYTTSLRIVYNTKMSEPVKITYLETDETDNQEADDAHQSTTIMAIKRVKGTAIKLKGCWKVFLNDGRELQKDSTELVNATNFFVDYAFEKMTEEQKRQQKQKEKRERAKNT
jgi:spore maturation protein CgeB